MLAPMTPQINLTELDAGTREFPVHYSVLNNPDFAPTIVVSMSDLTDAVEVNGGIADIKEIVIRLIHRYDGTNWFLTLQCCQIDLDTNKLVAFGNRFDLNNGKVTPSPFKDDYDPVYFDNVLFDGQPITPDNYVHSVSFPWYQEIKEMQCQNNLLNEPDVYLKIAACTYDYSTHPKASLVPFPHIVIIYLNTPSGGDYVNDTVYSQQFAYKAADMGGLCPPCCNQYYWPAALPKIPTCL